MQRTALRAAASGLSDERRVTFGIRRVELAANDTPDTTARPYTFFLDLQLKREHSTPLSRNCYTFSRTHNFAPLLYVPATSLAVQTEVVDGEWRLRITNPGEHTALFAWLADARAVGANGYAYFSDNHFCLFPQESIAIYMRWHNVNVVEAERSINVSAWNTLQTIIQ